MALSFLDCGILLFEYLMLYQTNLGALPLIAVNYWAFGLQTTLIP
jgi:hypothetical protein